MALTGSRGEQMKQLLDLTAASETTARRKLDNLLTSDETVQLPGCANRKLSRRAKRHDN